MLLIGITGRAQAGKTEAAEAIREHCELETGDYCEVLDIGQEVLEYCKQLGIIPAHKLRSELGNDELEILQREGKSAREEHGKDFFLKRIDKKIKERTPDVVVLPNVRYPDEGEFVHSRGGLLYRIVCKNPNWTTYISRDRDPNHQSETAQQTITPDREITVIKGDAALLGSLAITTFMHDRARYL